MGRRPVVLMYHGFWAGTERPDDPYDLHVAAADLDAQLGMLRARRWAPMDLSAYLRALDAPRAGRRYLVTIDDGLASVAAVGAPVLARHGVPSILFVCPDLLGRATPYLPATPDVPMLDVAALRSLPDQGVEIGGHGLDHTTMLGMSDADLVRHTRGVREALGDVTGTAPRSFAYPFGDHDERARRAVAAAGYDVAFSVFDDVDRFAISRVDVKPGDTLTTLRIKLVPGYRRLWRASGAVKPLRRLVRTITWRRR